MLSRKSSRTIVAALPIVALAACADVLDPSLLSDAELSRDLAVSSLLCGVVAGSVVRAASRTRSALSRSPAVGGGQVIGRLPSPGLELARNSADAPAPPLFYGVTKSPAAA